MKYLTGMLLLLFMQIATAGQCRVDGGDWQDVFRNSITVTVNVNETPGTGLILLDGYLLECRYTPSGFPASSYDRWRTNTNALVPGPKFSGHGMGLRIGRFIDVPVPVDSGFYIASMNNNSRGVDLDTYMYIYTIGKPGNYVDIRVGDILGTMNFRQTNNTGEPESDVAVHLQAGNDFYFQPSTCTINDNKSIDVDFDQVVPLEIGQSPANSPVQKTIRLNYSCPDPGITSAITITFKGRGALFNSNFLTMSNPNLGTGLLRKGVLVRPGSSFATSIANSVGADDVTFSLIRKTGSFPAAGPFTGSATLIMGVP